MEPAHLVDGPMMAMGDFVSFTLILCMGIFTQAATGFAGGLVIMPLMLWAGHGIPEAQAALLAATVPQNAFGVYRFRRTLSVPTLALPLVLRLMFIPFGIAALYVMDSFPVARLRQVIGGVVILCVCLFLFFRPRPKERIATAWTWLAFTVSGFFAGCTGTGGPFMVLWAQAHDWSTERTRGFLFAMYLASFPFLLMLLFWTFGERILSSVNHALLLIPLLLLVTWAGLHFGSWLGRTRLRRITMGILLLIGIVSVLAPVVTPLWRTPQ